MASAPPVSDVEEKAKCPLCVETLTDPVPLDCGHHFCRGCITRYCEKWKDLGDLVECPACRVRIQHSPIQTQQEKVPQAASPNTTNQPPPTTASAPLAPNAEEELKCPICLELLAAPVTLDCGHNFCRGCITEYCEKWDDMEEDPECPVCKVRIRGRTFRSNWQLSNVAENLRHKKSHLCMEHKRELNLFCKEDEELVCVACERSPEHRPHTVLLLEEASQEYKERLHSQLQFLDQKRGMLMKRKEAEEQRSQRYLKLLEVEKQEITSLFKEMHEFLEGKERCWLMELAEVESEIKKRQEKNMTMLSAEISHFSELIKDVEVWIWKSQETPSEFLQDIRCSLSRCQELQAPREKLELSPGLEWRVRRFCLKSSAFKRAVEDFEGSLNQEPSKESVTLEPYICAHPSLFISENRKNVTWTKTDPKYCSPSYVLGLESFTSGRHFWEVNISYSLLLMRKMLFPDGTCEQWAAGVARESICSETAIRISPNNGMWTIGKDPFRRHSLLGNPSLDWSLLPLIYQPRKIRVFLDCEEGCVEFFDADTDDFIFAFPPASFSGERIHPFFWLESEIQLQC